MLTVSAIALNFVLYILILISCRIVDVYGTEKEVNYSASPIQCNDKNHCEINCTLDMECAHSTLYCNEPDSICNIRCIGYKSCYYTVIISKSYDFNLLCGSNTASSLSCYGIAVTTTFDSFNNNKTSSLNIDCKSNLYYPYDTTGTCQTSSFYISNIEQIKFNCFGQYDCQYARFIISDSNSIQINCDAYYGCNGAKINFGNNINSVNILCDSAYSCNNIHINANNNKMQTSLRCAQSSSCSNVYLSCFINKIASCMVTCSFNGCSSIYIAVAGNNYLKDFVTFNQYLATSNYVYMQCLNSITNTLFHTTNLNVISSSFKCSDIICCPFIQPILYDIICEEGSHCNATCIANQNYTNCGIVNASKALSLNVQCVNCVSTQIICPKNKESICNITCLAANGIHTGCLDLSIDANHSKNVYLQCAYHGVCQYTALYTKNTDSNVFIECLGNESCSNMSVYAMTVKHVSLRCIDCSYLNVYVPQLSESTHIECTTSYSCQSLSINVYGIYQHQFTTFDCSHGYCGKIQFKCYSDSNSYPVSSNMTSNTSCSDLSCCPFTHKHIQCKNINNTDNNQCTINCVGDDIKNVSNGIVCSSQYIYGANKINCNGKNACNQLIVFCTEKNCNINCMSYSSITESTCYKAMINTNSNQELVINCFNYSCQYMKIKVNDTNKTEIKCVGDSSCNKMYVDVSNGGDINILSTAINYGYSSLQLATINASNANQLILQCDGAIGQNACDKTNIFISQNTYLQCNGAACKDLSLYSNVNGSITNKQLNVLLNECEICSSSPCINQWDMYCGYHYSQHSIFDGITCSNNNCCHKNIFVLENDYDECVNDEWEPLDNDTSEGIYYFGLSISILSAFSFLIMISQFIYHRRCGQTHIVPLFILGYINITDFIMNITIFYLLFCFGLTRVDLLWHCSHKYPIGDISVMNSLCDNDTHCDMLGYEGRCHVNSVFNGLSITFYVFFGLYVPCFALQGMWVIFDHRGFEIGNSFWIRCHQICNRGIWKNTIIEEFNKIKYFDNPLKSTHDPMSNLFVIAMGCFFIILYGLAVFAYIFTEFYSHCQWFVLYLVIFVFIIAQLLKIYYRSFVPYNKNENSVQKKEKLLSSIPNLKSSKHKP